MTHFRFDEATHTLYHFVWGTLCDWYLELIKPILGHDTHVAKQETSQTFAWTLGQILHVIHPFMPFISETLWSHLSQGNSTLLSSSWPTYSDEDLRDQHATAEINWIIGFISHIRSLLTDLNIPKKKTIPIVITQCNPLHYSYLHTHQEQLHQLTQTNIIQQAPSAQGTGIQILFEDCLCMLLLEGIVDFEQEKKHLQKKIQALQTEMTQLDTTLQSREFLSKAPESVIEEKKERRLKAHQRSQRLQERLSLFSTSSTLTKV